MLSGAIDHTAPHCTRFHKTGNETSFGSKLLQKDFTGLLVNGVRRKAARSIKYAWISAFPGLQIWPLVTDFEILKLQQRTVEEKIKVGLQIISLSVRGSFDFIRVTLWYTFQTDPVWPLGLQ